MYITSSRRERARLVLSIWDLILASSRPVFLSPLWSALAEEDFWESAKVTHHLQCVNVSVSLYTLVSSTELHITALLVSCSAVCSFTVCFTILCLSTFRAPLLERRMVSYVVSTDSSPCVNLLASSRYLLISYTPTAVCVLCSNCLLFNQKLVLN